MSNVVGSGVGVGVSEPIGVSEISTTVPLFAVKVGPWVGIVDNGREGTQLACPIASNVGPVLGESDSKSPMWTRDKYPSVEPYARKVSSTITKSAFT